MNRSLKVIAEMGCEEKRALLIEMPQDMIQGLKIGIDGTVDNKCLMGMLLMVEQEAALLKHDNGSIPEQLELMLNIFDTDRAAHFSHIVKS